jgi:hypothetical protein
VKYSHHYTSTLHVGPRVLVYIKKVPGFCEIEGIREKSEQNIVVISLE